jgi:DNA polymerase III epsilon subunit-like protein
MIDIETLGLRQDAIITQIGAVFFNLTGIPGEYGEAFRMNVDIGSQKGRTVSTSTIQFWLGQSKAASAHMIAEDNRTLEEALRELRSFLMVNISGRPRENSDKLFVWANGACFDFPILESAFNDYGIDIPWAYHQVNDLRTLRNLVHPKRSEEEYHSSFATGDHGLYHDALDDCRTQVAMLQELLVDIQNSRLPVG